MKNIYETITPRLKDFIDRQKVFFVATAPIAADGHINLSPKGYDTFRILGPTSVAYLDLNGSGVETIAHVRENGRMVIMFCAFEGPPKIVRLYGTATTVTWQMQEFSSLMALFPNFISPRAIIKLDVKRISASCGFSVPLYAYVSDRDQLEKWSAARGKEWLVNYQRENNQFSIDGICALNSNDID